jgi:hypothetical protein
MRARALVLITACAALGLVAWIALVLGDAGSPGPAPAPDVVHAAEPAQAPGSAAAIDADAVPAVPLAAVEPAPVSSTARRAAGLPPPPPDSLVSVEGRVVDAQSGKPVGGLTLGFLSRRPRTVLARTDGDGRFKTAAELTSGVVSVAHVPDPESPLFAARYEIEPTSFLASAPPPTPVGAAGGTATAEEVVLRARSPERTLDVDVRLPDGGPAAGAAVSLTSGRRDAAGRFEPVARAYEESDANGRARFALFGTDAWEASFRVEAEHGGTLASDVLSLDPPTGRAPRTLGLHPGGIVRVRTRNDEGRPVAGVSLWISAHEDFDTVRGRAGDTDARGECLFTALRPGCYTVSAIHPSTGAEIRREVELARGEQETVDVALSLAGLRLRLSGTVVDEFGYPLAGVAVRAQAPGERWVALASGEGGRFEFWGPPAESILFGAGGGFLDDRYEPELLSVPGGTSGIVVRRLAKLETRSWACRIRDRATGERVLAAIVTLHHGDPRGPSESRQDFTAASGVVQLTFKQREGTAYAVDAPGYLRQEGSLAELIATGAGVGILTIELDPGFERTVQVRDRVTRRAVPGATLSAGALLSARTDERGVAVLRADGWPASVRVESAGYAPLSWDPATAGFPGDVIWLEPLRSGD